MCRSHNVAAPALRCSTAPAPRGPRNSGFRLGVAGRVSGGAALSPSFSAALRAYTPGQHERLRQKLAAQLAMHGGSERPLDVRLRLNRNRADIGRHRPRSGPTTLATLKPRATACFEEPTNSLFIGSACATPASGRRDVHRDSAPATAPLISIT